MSYTLSTLKSGLRVATETLPGMESATVAVSVDVGARNEHLSEGGISHLLEHMAFKGTKRRNARQIAEEMDMVGGNMNAYTSLENTVYHTRVMPRDVPLAVDVLADILQHSVFDKEELAREQHVILQEIAMHNDTPDDLVFDYFSETAYPDQPLGRSDLGSPKQVNAYARTDLARYMGKHYHAQNMVVSAAGNVNHGAFLKLVKNHFSELPAGKAPIAGKAHYKGGDKRVKKKFEQLHLTMGLEAVSLHDEDYYAWQVFSVLLGGGMSSRLFQEVREKRGLAYTVQAFLSAYDDTGVLAIYAATNESKAAEMVPVICDEVTKLRDGVSDAELLRAKNQINASLFMSRESTSSIAEWIGRHLLRYDRYKPAAELAKLVDAVTAQDITRIARSITGKGLTIAALGPQKGLPAYDKVQKRLA